MSRQRTADRPQTKQIMGAAVALSPGTVLELQHLKPVDWPINVPFEGAMATPEEAIGRVLLYPVAALEPLRQRDMAAAGTGFGLSARIPDGMRAAAVKTNEVNNIAGFLLPGSKVDVLVTLRSPETGPFTRTVLQNVQVLSAGQKTEPDPQGKPENVSVVTLLVTPEESEKLVLAQNQGSIQFVLRNSGDTAIVDATSVRFADLAGTPKPAPAPEMGPRKARVAAPRPAVHVVETVIGDKSTTAQFDVPR